MQRLIKPLVFSVIAASLIACTKQGPADGASAGASAPAAASGQPVVGLAVSTLNNPFFVSLRKGAEDEAAKEGVRLITVDAQDDSAKQQASVEDLIQKKVSVILINPTDSSAVANVVKEAVSKGIKVVSLDRSVNGTEVSAHIASDNVAGGKMAADFLLQKLGGKGRLVELEGIPGSSAARERGQGFHAVADGKAEVKVVAKQPADFDRAKGLSVMENILQGNKDVQGVFAHNDEMALGALKAIQAAGLKNVVVVGFDATADAVASVKAGGLAATVQQQPELIGQYGVQTAKKLIDGQQVEKFIPVPLNLVKQ
ncbi:MULTISPECIES: ribose ABC transporter substrate-binding protein RbsB [Chromobacterium]|uniref:ribose ABC transporter substrate-binding protein RbsB n=1 Tax=Chromobacterium TaxID=535 RepID=UPI0018870988|nr:MULTISPECIES: ribose ABC transporter substrate-binding protein RbsB [Chromobacterium]QOZ84581.1 ribose ABC transporter substrate-binding protein RbsB [Chromobacterium sp. Rain0013]WON84761.1 ribose ABC transporter substrate-binding protein RbsB [Chromobacterium haemolyticum]